MAVHTNIPVTIINCESDRPSLFKSASTPGKDFAIHNKQQIKRTQSIKERITQETAKFFGVPSTSGNEDDDNVRVVAINDDEEMQKWQQRRFRHLKREYGVRIDAIANELQNNIEIDALPDLTDQNDVQNRTNSIKKPSDASTVFCASSTKNSTNRLSYNVSTRRAETIAAPTVRIKQSAAQIAIDTLSSILRGEAFRQSRNRRVSTSANSSLQNTAKRIAAGNGSFCTIYDLSPQPNVDRDAHYCPIRKRNIDGGISTSFPALRHHATAKGIAQTDATVKNVSKFFIGTLSRENDVKLPSIPNSHSAAETIQVKSEATTISREDMVSEEVKEFNLSDEKDEKRAISAKIARESRYHYTLPARSKSTSSGGRRPNYLPLRATKTIETQDKVDAPINRRSLYRSSPSITANDLFFDISPSQSDINASCLEEKLQNDTKELDFEESNRPSSSSPDHLYGMKKTKYDYPNAISRASQTNVYDNTRAPLSRPCFVRQNSYELDDYPTLVSSNALTLQCVEYTSGGEHVNFVQSYPKKANEELNKIPTIAPKNPILRHLKWYKNVRNRSHEKNDKEKAPGQFRSLLKFRFSSRHGYTGQDKINKNKLGNNGKKRSLPIFGSMDPNIARQLRDESSDYRPFFTFWITTVQVIVMAVMLMRYGIGTDFSNLSNLLGVIERSGDVTSTFLSISHIVVWEQNNIWIGPRFADLVHAGAKYTPCMKIDASIYSQIMAERHEEAHNTGCCIGAEGGCFQGSECPKQFARLVKWSNTSLENDIGVDNALMHSQTTIRVVCGQDPRYCIRPQSVPPFRWNRTDFSKWPTCELNRSPTLIHRRAEHMHCTITGRPCCIQMHGQCRITTSEYCAFVRGHYHPNATLCSQVSCLNSVCGMTAFLSADRPDQLYRLITPLFMHAGIIRCFITIGLQMTIMRNFEIMIGWLRLAIIYFISGIGGYLASAVFVPYMPEVGPAGSQGGVLGALIVNVLYNWHFLRHPNRTLVYHILIAAVLFLTGLLPFVDNWAQLFGFVFGCLLASALIPYIVFGKCDGKVVARRRKRLVIVSVSLIATAVIFIMLITLFYTFPASSFAEFNIFQLLNCPFPGKVCEQQGLFLRSWLPI